MLVVADPERVGEIAGALSEPLPTAVVSRIEVVTSSGGDDTVELFESSMPPVVVVTATLDAGDTKSLVEAMRGMAPRGEVRFVVVGDADGPIRTALDAADLEPDRFVQRPLVPRALRFAVASALEMVMLVRGPATGANGTAVTRPGTSPGFPAVPMGADGRSESGRMPTATESGRVPRTESGPVSAGESGRIESRAATESGRIATPRAGTANDGDAKAAQRARWEALADSLVDDEKEGVVDADDLLEEERAEEVDPLPPPIIIRPRRMTEPPDVVPEAEAAAASPAPADEPPAEPPQEPPAEPLTAVAQEPEGSPGRDATGDTRSALYHIGIGDGRDTTGDTRSALYAIGIGAGRASVVEVSPGEATVPNPEPPPLDPGSSGVTDVAQMRFSDPALAAVAAEPVAAEAVPTASRYSEPEMTAPVREPTLILNDLAPPPAAASVPPPGDVPLEPRTRTGDDKALIAERPGTDETDEDGEKWSEPMPLAELLDRDSKREIESLGSADARSVAEGRRGVLIDTPRTATSDDLGLPLDDYDDYDVAQAPEPRLEVLDDLPDADPSPAPQIDRPDGRDFARQLRAKMSQMAQRLFQGAAAAPAPQDLAPRHDASTEIDLSGLGDDLPLGGGVTEIESRARERLEGRDLTTSPGSWDTQVRERGLPDTGEVMRGVSDASMLLAKMFALGATGRVAFRRDEIEKVVFFDQGRPVFASSSEQRDRMGELLLREGKITAAQYERCQAVVAESGRRMGEILVDFGYLKRRELLPAVRRHVEDIVYSLFGWDRGTYRIAIEQEPSAERIRLSRHPAALILEGVRRKLDRSTLEKIIGPPSTVIEVADRERLGGIINMGDLAPEERGALAAIDGQADLAAVARVAAVDIADVMPLAWGLCVLGLATLRRTDTEVQDESTALVGETDLAIDRERVRARWNLVTEADYFALLGVRRDATAFEIRRAYQSARRDYAADCFPPDLRRELAQELDDIANVLDEAFRVLRDDRLRQTYLQNLVE